MRFRWVILVLCLTSVAHGEHDRAMELFMQDISSNRQRTPSPPRPAAPAKAPSYEVIDGEANRTHGFFRTGELWVQKENGVERLFAAGDPIVISPDGKQYRYSQVQDYLKRYVSSYGPLKIQVHKIAGGASFVQLRLFQNR